MRKEFSGKAVNLAAFYLRLSDADGVLGTSESIENQRSLLSDYIKDKPEFRLVATFTDDGKTGTDFNRPGFKDMMQAVKKGMIDCIIVKDLSRFSRNFLESGNYIENIFPTLGIRFIAVTDGFDTSTASASEMNLLMPLKNMMNENYARDISVKERSAKKTLRKKGCFLGAHGIYGYVKSKKDKHRLCIDPEAAEVVTLIFDLGAQGYSDAAIAKYLNERKIWSPAKYKYEKGILHHEKYAKSVGWYPQTVATILTSRTYIGDVVQGGYCTNEMKGKRVVLPREEWDIVPGQHEAIISAEQYEQVAYLRAVRHQKYLSTRQRTSGEARLFRTKNILKGKVFCADCNTALERKYEKKCSDKYRFVCGVYEKTGGCRRKYIAESDLHSALFTVINNRIGLTSDIAWWVSQNNRGQRQQLEYFNEEIMRRRQEAGRLRKTKSHLYGDWKSGLLDKEEYQVMKESCLQKIAVRKTQLQLLENERAEYITNYTSKNLAAVPVLSVPTRELLSKEVVAMLIDRIEVFEYGRVKVYFKFEDELRTVIDYINSTEQKWNDYTT